ncbi:hypothetical protein S101258_02229 [Lactiplantibacillus plantarum subsp. plantarum]|uniref:Uncharacterized protein n=1 Tax=Lactiplantibacillus plantarum subsp. plantarum TaxID=337330 RepID=A0A2S3U414_LACPN|nr:hypothetical protein S101258_02229 [Lactiplantibacillus plantarum subsp. plantarum]
MNIKRYGVDAPFALLIYTVFWWWDYCCMPYVNRLNYPIGIEMTLGIILLLGALIFLHTTAQGKYRLFDEAMHRLKSKTGQSGLRLVCGRGALLTRIAQR